MTTEMTAATTRELTHFIGGRHIAGASNRFGDVFDPSTGEAKAT